MALIAAVLPSLALITYAAYQYQHDNYWWTYVPAIGIAGITCIHPLPSVRLWRIISSVVIVGGTLLMLFLCWTFHSLEETAGYDLKEAGNLPFVAIGVALTASTRLLLGPNTNFVHYLRSFILILCLMLGFFITAYSIKYYFV
ncbi:hypothetical protein KIN20_006445 [Parelaphostrongylus tenuis]|uniref:Uncharacterized protein n=1 Tax=Parelaphostrongylus tenuis TaxID=148309 RepID=A0AAD5MK59_PARTN|nr:hypothetical protein KIN20_006445 [Parelaphostrongylus tenuis]